MAIQLFLVTHTHPGWEVGEDSSTIIFGVYTDQEKANKNKADYQCRRGCCLTDVIPVMPDEYREFGWY